MPRLPNFPILQRLMRRSKRQPATRWHIYGASADPKYTAVVVSTNIPSGLVSTVSWSESMKGGGQS